MSVTVFTEVLHPGAFIVSEREGFYSRDTGKIPQNQTIVAGMVLGRTADVTQATASAAQAAGNVGDGAITMDGTAPVRGDAQDGVYEIVFLTAGATAEFEVIGPDGIVVGSGAVGTTFAGPIKFAIVDDTAHHYAAGDRILVTVALPVAAIFYEALNLSATDGSQFAAAVAVYPAVTGAGQTAKIAVISRESEVRQSDLTWPAGITVGQTAEAIVQLRKRGIIAR